jgi:hypothetical protein
VPFPIQRVAQGLLNLLSLQGGNGPHALEENVRSILDVMQLYGLQQLQTLSASANPAEGSSVSLSLSASSWTVLFGCSAEFTKTATLTALRGQVALTRSGFTQPLAAEELGPFGATETGVATVAFWAPYPIVCPPGSLVTAVPTIIGTDASVFTTARAHFGVLG